MIYSNTNLNFKTFFYTSEKLENTINDLKSQFPFLNTFSIGQSVMGNNIPCLKVGNGNKKLLFFASIHANELITTNILMQFFSDFYADKENLHKCTLYILPLVNPDGANLFLDTIPKDSKYYLNCKNISANFPNIPFPNGWKANISGVDLNLQFPADWNTAKNIKSTLRFFYICT